MSTTPGDLPPLENISSANLGPAVVVVGYVLMLTALTFTVTRVITTFTSKRGFGPDDAFLIVASCIALPQTVIVGKAADNGLGRHIDTVRAADLSKYYKYTYAGELLAIVAMLFAKLSVVHLVGRLGRHNKNMVRLCFLVAGLCLVWGILSIFALAFQCGSKNPQIYTPQRCSNHGAVWYPVVILNIITDAILSVFFVPTLWKLQASRTQRLTVIALFMMRLVVVGTEIGQMAVLPSALKAQDQTREELVPTIMQQIVMNLSIMAAAAPSVHRFLGNLQSGQGFNTRLPDPAFELSMAQKYGPGYGSNVSNGSAQDKSQARRGLRGLFSSNRSINRSINRSKNLSSHGHEKTPVPQSHDVRDGDSSTRSLTGADHQLPIQQQSYHNTNPGMQPARKQSIDAPHFRPDMVGQSQTSVEAANKYGSGRSHSQNRASDGSEEQIIRQTVGWDVRYDTDNSGQQVHAR